MLEREVSEEIRRFLYEELHHKKFLSGDGRKAIIFIEINSFIYNSYDLRRRLGLLFQAYRVRSARHLISCLL